MSMLICPLCGKSNSLKKFDPSRFDNDIYTHRVKGLGRGRGFKVVEKDSILGNNFTTQLIGDRVLEIASLLISQGAISTSKALTVFQSKKEPLADNDKLKRTFDELKAELRLVERERKNWKDHAESLEIRIVELNNQLEKVKRQSDLLDSEAKTLEIVNEEMVRESNKWEIEAETLESDLNKVYAEIDEMVEWIESSLNLHEARFWDPVETLKMRIMDMIDILNDNKPQCNLH